MAKGGILHVSQTRFRGINGVLSLQRKIAALPDAIVAEVKPALEDGADHFVERLKETLPESTDLDPHPGALRESAHREQGPTELSVRVVVDAKDEHGDPFGAHVEYGHMAADGTHVEALPAFWPTYQVEKRVIRSRIQRAATKGVKKAVAAGGDGSNGP